MKLKVVLAGMEPANELRMHLDRRLRFALSRYGERVGRVTAIVQPDSGGIACRITVDIAPRGRVQTETLEKDAWAASARASERVGRSVARELDRQSALLPANGGGLAGSRRRGARR